MFTDEQELPKSRLKILLLRRIEAKPRKRTCDLWPEAILDDRDGVFVSFGAGGCEIKVVGFYLSKLLEHIPVRGETRGEMTDEDDVVELDMRPCSPRTFDELLQTRSELLARGRNVCASRECVDQGVIIHSLHGATKR